MREPRTEQSTLTVSVGEPPAERPGFVGDPVREIEVDLSVLEDPPRREAELRDDLFRSVGRTVPLVLTASSIPLLSGIKPLRFSALGFLFPCRGNDAPEIAAEI